MVVWDLTKVFPRPSTGPYASSLPKAVCKFIHTKQYSHNHSHMIPMYLCIRNYLNMQVYGGLICRAWFLWSTTSGPKMGPAKSHHQVKHHTLYLPGMLNEIYSLKGLGLDINKDEALHSKAKDGKF